VCRFSPVCLLRFPPSRSQRAACLFAPRRQKPKRWAFRPRWLCPSSAALTRSRYRDIVFVTPSRWQNCDRSRVPLHAGAAPAATKTSTDKPTASCFRNPKRGLRPGRFRRGRHIPLPLQSRSISSAMASAQAVTCCVDLARSPSPPSSAVGAAQHHHPENTRR